MSIFTEDYQIKVLVLLARRELNSESVYLKPEFFYSKSLIWSFRNITKLLLTYNEINPDMLENERRVDEETKDWGEVSVQSFEKFLDIFSGKIQVLDFLYVKNTLQSFIKTRELSGLLNTNNDILQIGDWDLLRSTIDKEFPKFLSVENTPLFYDTDFTFLNEEALIKTSFDVLDMYMGGFYRKEVTILLGDSNIGKSLWLIWMTAQIVRNKYRVLYITLEMSKQRTIDRLFVSILDQEEIFKYSDYRNLSFNSQLREYFDTLRELYRKRYTDYLRIIKRQNSGFTLAELSNILRQIPCDVLILDYVDLMKPDQIAKDAALFRKGQKDLIEGLRDFANDFNIGILTISQANRQAVNKEIISTEFMADDYGKVRAADNIIAIGANENTLLAGERVFYVAKARNSEKGSAFRYKVNFEKMSFSFMNVEAVQIRPARQSARSYTDMGSTENRNEVASPQSYGRNN